MRKLEVSKYIVGFLTLILVAALFPTTSNANWRPTQAIIFLVMAGEDGRADKTARLVAGIVNEKKIAATKISVRNLPGNSGADALEYMQANAEHNHLQLFTLNSCWPSEV